MHCAVRASITFDTCRGCDAWTSVIIDALMSRYWRSRAGPCSNGISMMYGLRGRRGVTKAKEGICCGSKARVARPHLHFFHDTLRLNSTRLARAKRARFPISTHNTSRPWLPECRIRPRSAVKEAYLCRSERIMPIPVGNQLVSIERAYNTVGSGAASY